MIPSTIDDIKSAKFPNRKQAFECLQLFNAKLNPPKKLKTVKEKMGSRVTYRCIDGSSGCNVLHVVAVVLYCSRGNRFEYRITGPRLNY